MYALLFAGGVGQRLWPLSRRNTPKQFSPIIGGDKSSFQMAVSRLQTIIAPEDIYVATNERFAEVLKDQASGIPESNFILEPTRRDLGAATALAFFMLYKKGLRGSILFQWTDNYIQRDEKLIECVNVADKLIQSNPNRVVIIGETPRFPNDNLGWVELGNREGTIDGTSYHGFSSWKYRPTPNQCVSMFESGKYVWNSGFFFSDIDFVVSQYRRVASEITTIVEEITSYSNTELFQSKLKELYPTIPVAHFDKAFLERLRPEHITILKSNTGWADPGTLYALKEALQISEEQNVTSGNVVNIDTEDSLIINEELNTVVSVMGMTGAIIVNTADALLVISKDSVRNMPSLLKRLADEGYSNLL